MVFGKFLSWLRLFCCLLISGCPRNVISFRVELTIFRVQYIRPSYSFSLLRINTIVLTFIVRSLCEKSLFLCAVPDGQGDNTELEVYRFKHPGGVAMSMYNTDEVLSRITWMIVDWSLYVWNFIFLCWTVNTSFCWGFNEYCSPKEMAPLS